MTTDIRNQTAITEKLGVSAATASDLASQLKEAHWVITGANFIALHELFDRLAHLMRDHVDAFAERMRQLGAVPRGTIRQAARQTELDDFPAEIQGEHDVVGTLIERYDTFRAHLEEAASTAGDEGDMATEDLYVGVLRSANLQRWFLHSHLEDRA